MSTAAITTDPRWTGEETAGVAEQLFHPLLRDERDGIFVRTSLAITAVVPPLALVMFLVPWQWTLALAVPYLATAFGLFGGRYVLMVHALCHRPLFRKGWRGLESWITWVLGPFFGLTPTSFYVHHMGMHHPENNLEDDLSSTIAYKRDELGHFLHYWARFFFMGHVHLVRYLRSRKRDKLAWMFLRGELAWLALVVGLMFVDPVATFVVFIVPVLMIRFFFMCGNWAQHAFVDVDDAGNPYRNSTCLTNTIYNHKCYNDGYHIVHHIKPALHWSEMAQWYEDRIPEFAAQGAIVFDGIHNNQKVWMRLMLKDYDYLARHVVRFEGDTRTDAEVAEWLRERVQRTLGTRKGLFESREVVRA